MKHIKILMLLLLISILYSCKKDKQTEPIDDILVTNNSASEFSQLKVGNYWIYQEFTIDTLGNVIPTSVYDSCYVEKDTILKGKTYFKLWKPLTYGSFGQQYFAHYVRDSADCMLEFNSVYKSDFIIFSRSNFSTSLNIDYGIFPPDTIWKQVTKMVDVNLNVIVPAGTFSTLNSQITYYIDPRYTDKTTRYLNTRYAKNIGIVSETALFYLSFFPGYTERRLVRYHLN